MEKTETVSYETARDGYLKTVTEIHAAYFARNLSNLTPPRFEVECGRSFDKIIMVSTCSSGRSVHSFVARADGNTKSLGARKCGDIMKAASWKAPARHPRGSIFGDVSKALDPHGSVNYLF